MRNAILSVKRFLVSEDGPTAVEYAVMLALILVACITIVTTLGTERQQTFSKVNSSMGPLLMLSRPWTSSSSVTRVVKRQHCHDARGWGGGRILRPRPSSFPVTAILASVVSWTPRRETPRMRRSFI